MVAGPGELAGEGGEAGRQEELVAVMAQPGLAAGAGDVVAGEIGDAAECQPVDEHECTGDSQVQRHAGVVQAGTELPGVLAVAQDVGRRGRGPAFTARPRVILCRVAQLMNGWTGI